MPQRELRVEDVERSHRHEIGIQCEGSPRVLDEQRGRHERADTAESDADGVPLGPSSRLERDRFCAGLVITHRRTARGVSCTALL